MIIYCMRSDVVGAGHALDMIGSRAAAGPVSRPVVGAGVAKPPGMVRRLPVVALPAAGESLGS